MSAVCADVTGQRERPDLVVVAEHVGNTLQRDCDLHPDELADYEVVDAGQLWQLGPVFGVSDCESRLLKHNPCTNMIN